MTALNVQLYRVVEGQETPPPVASIDAAQNWATKVNGPVADGEYSAKAHAQSTDGSAPPTGSSKQWASKTGSAVAGGEFSAKHWAGIALSAAGSAVGAVIANQPIVNNQAAPADIAALDFAGLIGGLFVVCIERVTTGVGAQSRYQVGVFLFLKKGASYEISPISVTGDDPGVELTITAGGKVQYTSSNQTGDASVSRVSSMHWSFPTPA